jgi:hypothetical protein
MEFFPSRIAPSGSSTSNLASAQIRKTQASAGFWHWAHSSIL